jgi:hypothetical protein
MSTLRTKIVAVTAVAAAIVAGTETTASAAGSRAGVPIHAVTTHTVSVPATMQPGRVRFHNTAAVPLFVFKKKHYGVTQLAKDLNKSANSPTPGRLIQDFSIVDLIDGHTYVYLPLTRGTYYFLDASLDHYKTSDVRTVTVSGKTRNAAAPASRPVSIPQTGSMSAPATMAHNRYLHVQNRTGHLQEVLLIALSSKVSTAQLNDFLAAPTFDKLIELDITSIRDLAFVAGHRDLWAQGPHHAGRFLIVSFGFTATTAAPALHKSRVRLVKVS